MSVFLISFQYSGDQERGERIVAAIKSYGSWARITPFVWCIRTTDKTTADVRDEINEKCNLQDGDRLFVVNITNSPWASYYVPKSVADWLKEDK